MVRLVRSRSPTRIVVPSHLAHLGTTFSGSALPCANLADFLDQSFPVKSQAPGQLVFSQSAESEQFDVNFDVPELHGIFMLVV